MERSADVAAPLGEREPALARSRAAAAEQDGDGQSPATPELAGELLGRMVATAEVAIAVRWDEGQGVDVRGRHTFDDELGGESRDPPQAALLPAADECPDSVVVLDRGACGGEPESASRALAAASDRPGDRRTAAPAERRGDQRQSPAAACTELPPGTAAGEAA